MPLNHLGGRIPLSTAFQAGGTSYFVPGERSVHAVRGLEPGAPHRDGPGAAGGRDAVPALPKRRRPACLPGRRARRRRRSGGASGAARAGPRWTYRHQLQRHGAAVRGDEELHRVLSGRPRAGRLRTDRGRHGHQGRSDDQAAGDRLQTDRRPRAGLLPHRQAVSAWRAAGEIGDIASPATTNDPTSPPRPSTPTATTGPAT